MASTEDIEARLCAYIEGELDAAGRAEIERHLAENPQHRRLIEEVSRQREMLRSLPRERAPQDVSESINAQLERAALLGDDGLDHTPILRINRWPQIKAAAAILLLVLGLVSVVYYVLPRPGENASEFARVPPGVEPMTAGPSIADDSSAGGSVLTGRGEPDPEHRPPSPAESRTRLALVEEIPPVRGTSMSNAVEPSDEIISDVLSRANASSDTDTLVVVVDAPDPFAADAQVEQFLKANAIDFEAHAQDAPLPAPLALRESQIAMGSRLQRVNVKMKQTEAAPLVPDSPETDELTKREPESTRGAQPPDQAFTGAQRGKDQLPRKFVARSMKRREVATMCAELSDESAAQIAQIQDPNETPVADLTHPLRGLGPFAPNEIATGEGSNPVTADSPARFDLTPPTTQPHEIVKELFGFEAPATEPADQRVDVLIVVRGEPVMESEPATQPATESPDSPTTEPAGP